LSDTALYVLKIMLIAGIVGLLSAAALAWLSYWQLRKLKIEGSGFFVILRQTPIFVPLALDALDLGLDVLSAPLSWLLLARLGLSGLQFVSVIEGLIPGTQLIPFMTLCWLGVRLYDGFAIWYRARARRRQIAAALRVVERPAPPNQPPPPSK
jgi:hypothetical protein